MTYPVPRIPHWQEHADFKICADGTHADIVFVNGSDEIRLQSRNQLELSPGKDNAGFAAFIAATEKQKLLVIRDQILERYRKIHPNTKVGGDVVIAGSGAVRESRRKSPSPNCPSSSPLCL